MKTINIKSVLKIIGLTLMITAVFFLFCIPVAIIYSEPPDPFLFAFITAMVPGAAVYFLMPSQIREKVTTREGYLGVTMGWITLVLAGSLPYLYSNTIAGFTNSFFESVSGFTTTGASILTDIRKHRPGRYSSGGA